MEFAILTNEIMQGAFGLKVDEYKRVDDRAIIGSAMSDIWVRKSASFEEDRSADEEFWRAASPEARIAAVEELRQHWAKLMGISHEGLRRTVRVLQAPER